MLKEFRICNGRLAECQDNDKCLFVYIMPDKSEKAELIDKFKIDEHNLNSSLDPDEVGRVEFEPDHVVIILKRPKNYSTIDNLLFHVTSIGVFLFKDKIVIIMPEDIQILEGKQSLKLQSVQDILLKLIYGTIAHFLGHLKAINLISDSIEKKMSESMDGQQLIHMYSLEKSLVYYLNGINSNTMVVDKLRIAAVKIGFSPDNMEYLEDIIIENNQCMKLAETYSSILNIMITARGSFINNRLSLIMKRLTLITTIFMPLTVLVGIGGMSEWSMITGPHNWKLSYPIFFILMGTIIFITYKIFKWKGWT